MASRLIAVGDVFPLSNFVNYITSNWYLPDGQLGIASGAAIPAANTIRLIPGFIKQTVTLNSLGVRCTTLAAGGNLQAAIYANNSTTMRPTGTALASTASMSTAATGSLNSAISLQLQAGLYWWATNSDNTTAAFSQVQSGGLAAALASVGSATQNLLLNTGSGLAGVTTPVTFGTWGDLSAATFTDQIGSTAMPIVQFKVASVP